MFKCGEVEYRYLLRRQLFFPQYQQDSDYIHIVLNVGNRQNHGSLALSKLNVKLILKRRSHNPKRD